MIRLQAGLYELVEEHRNGWNQEAFRERYSDILDKYDFIVGDWGYGQLRLRGFFDSSNRKVPFEQRIDYLDEYLQEYCNFGCPYFVVRRVKNGQQPADGAVTVTIQAGEESTYAISHNRYDRNPNAERRERPSRSHSQKGERPEREERHTTGHAPKQGRGERHDKGKRHGDHPRGDAGGREQRSERSGKDRRGSSQHHRPPRDKMTSPAPNQSRQDKA